MPAFYQQPFLDQEMMLSHSLLSCVRGMSRHSWTATTWLSAKETSALTVLMLVFCAILNSVSSKPQRRAYIKDIFNKLNHFTEGLNVLMYPFTAYPQGVAAIALSNTTVNVSWSIPAEFLSSLVRYTLVYS